MPSYDAALIVAGAIRIVAVPLDENFSDLPESVRLSTFERIRVAVLKSPLNAELVVLWQDHRRQHHFLGPTRWRSFTESLSVGAVRRQLNRVIET